MDTITKVRQQAVENLGVVTECRKLLNLLVSYLEGYITYEELERLKRDFIK